MNMPTETKLDGASCWFGLRKHQLAPKIQRKGGTRIVWMISIYSICFFSEKESILLILLTFHISLPVINIHFQHEYHLQTQIHHTRRPTLTISPSHQDKVKQKEPREQERHERELATMDRERLWTLSLLGFLGPDWSECCVSCGKIMVGIAVCVYQWNGRCRMVGCFVYRSCCFLGLGREVLSWQRCSVSTFLGNLWRPRPSSPQILMVSAKGIFPKWPKTFRWMIYSINCPDLFLNGYI